MNAHTRKTYEAILGAPAPRDLEWDRFVTLWSDLADSVSNESGDRLAVQYQGHREVFRRPHDGRVSIEDVERARHLLKSHPEPKGVGTVAAVAIDAEKARILVFDLDAQKVVDRSETIRDTDPRARRLRTVERRTGRDDVADLTGYFDELADAVRADLGGRPFVVLGHGHGKSDVAAGFVDRLRSHHGELAQAVAGVADVDLSAADDGRLETETVAVLRR
ncbi:hypothetical protein P0W64_07215 [Tsukamurella sp. 8F]|uniref:hypothetical protein n=1 Tax=unclassified Tsukamurella TaxID=2633480 RepID=UPI0023B8CA91|nr:MULTISPECIES: hypothetical protein [unclassified Tsukamurella]MDF0530245.1 hypothetical protein [Tsukamurella sp. 8J]MDF0586562.1 hypothetical protein [Tsukamurella sp. 8F]